MSDANDDGNDANMDGIVLLHLHAIQLVPSSSAWTNPTLPFLYTDVDGDRAMIRSNAELQEAVAQFQNQGSLKVYINVVHDKKRTVQDQQPVEARHESASTQTVRVATDSTTQTNTTTSTIATEHNKGPPNQQVVAPPAQLEKVVDALVQAAAAVVIAISEVTPPLLQQQQPQAATVAVVPFVHGRHTCDECSTSPIVGQRYHATNIPNYDLCAKCKHNSKLNNILYEVVEWDRDVAFQERWRSIVPRTVGLTRRDCIHRPEPYPYDLFFSPFNMSRSLPLGLASSQAARHISLTDYSQSHAQEINKAHVVTQTNAAATEDQTLQADAPGNKNGDIGSDNDSSAIPDYLPRAIRSNDDSSSSSDDDYHNSEQSESDYDDSTTAASTNDDDTSAFMPDLEAGSHSRDAQENVPSTLCSQEMPRVVHVTSTVVASDAEGGEEVAAVLVETLDRVAKAIEETNWEVEESTGKTNVKKEQSQEEESDDGSHDSWNLVVGDK